jgi:PAS domain S-box-containing protein
MGKNHRMLKSGDQEDQIFVDMWKTISSGKTFRGEIKNKAKDGSFYWVDAIIAPVLDENGKPKEYIAQRFVINEQKVKEQEAGAQKAILDQVCIISKTDLQGNITYVNDEFLKWSKYSKEEVMGKNHRILKSGDQDDQIFVDMWKTISSGKIFRGEIKNKAKDGSFYWVDAIVAPVLDDKGKPVEYMAQRFVINEQKEKEHLIQQSMEEMRSQEEEIRQNLEEVKATSEEMERVMSEMNAQNAIINSVAIVSKTDLQGNITYVNDEFVKWAKYSKEEVIGKNHRILRHPDMPAAAFENMWKTISSGKIWRGEVKNKAKDGSFYWVDAIIAPVLDENGKPKEYIAQRFVINEQKEKERLLQELLDKNKK